MPQYKKNKPFKMKNNGIKRVKTDKIGNIFGAKKGKIYATKVTIIRTIFKLYIALLNQESFFIFLLVPLIRLSNY
jgi:hypothetical protein